MLGLYTNLVYSFPLSMAPYPSPAVQWGALRMHVPFLDVVVLLEGEARRFWDALVVLT